VLVTVLLCCDNNLRGFYCWFYSKLNIEFWTTILAADFGHVLLLVLGHCLLLVLLCYRTGFGINSIHMLDIYKCALLLVEKLYGTAQFNCFRLT
jgi:hypothetical protein